MKIDEKNGASVLRIITSTGSNAPEPIKAASQRMVRHTMAVKDPPNSISRSIFMSEKKPIIAETRLSDIRFNGSLYPRKEHDPALVQQYAENLAEIEGRGNFISVSKDLTILDGRHRHLAYLKTANGNQDKMIPVILYDLESDADKFAMAVELNIAHIVILLSVIRLRLRLC